GAGSDAAAVSSIATRTTRASVRMNISRGSATSPSHPPGATSGSARALTGTCRRPTRARVRYRAPRIHPLVRAPPCPQGCRRRHPRNGGENVRALTWQGKRNVSVETVPDPTMTRPDDVIIEVTSTAICGSDLHLYEVLVPFMDEGDII